MKKRNQRTVVLEWRGRMLGLACALMVIAASSARGERVLVEAESFAQHGGWSLDTQFIEIMGSPYLLAHGLGRPVPDAQTSVQFAKPGRYRVFVRTKDWVGRWQAPGAPGKFQVLVNGKPLAETFGAKGAEWSWQRGGEVEIPERTVQIALHDLTGFDGRCDALYFTDAADDAPPASGSELAGWRRSVLGLTEKPLEAGTFDLVVVGGGYSGMAAAISAARMGCRVALIQNRGVLGGNGSSEIRVWAQGGTRRGLYPYLGEIVEEFMDRAKESPGTYEEFGDAKKEAIVRAEQNISLFLNHHAEQVEMEGKRIASVIAFNTMTSERKRFRGRVFADCTGHATIGFMAGADYSMQEEGHLGMSNMWRWEESPQAESFPETPWALDLTLDDFPYPQRFHAQWFWESGFDKHPIEDLEDTRDWNLRAIYGAFNAMKNRDGKAEHSKARLVWVAYVGGTRESRQLLGDVILTRPDIVEKKAYPDGCVPTTWDIDLHYPKKQYQKKYPEDPFISIAVFDKSVDRKHGYPVPYRCFYSRNIENLFMAGRCVSVTHEALGTVRVMKTGGMMGEVVGKAASICARYDCAPRDVYTTHFNELKELMQLRGVARRETVTSPIFIREDAAVLPQPEVTFLDPAKLEGLVVDDPEAKLTGSWSKGEGLKNYVGDHYLYHGPGQSAAARFEFSVPKTGKYEVRLAYGAHENRATKVPVQIESAEGSKVVPVNQRVGIPGGFVSLGQYQFEKGKPGAVTVSNEGADGFVHADAVQLLWRE